MTLVCGDLARLEMNATSRVLMARDEVDRLVMMRTDLDRYEAELIPDLQQRVLDLTRALKVLIAASGDTNLANQKEALAIARRTLSQPGSRPTPG
jgi:hypothetical protein